MKKSMSKPITDKAEVTLEYPDKLYIGTFGSSSRFEAHIDAAGIALVLERPGAEDVHKSIHMHIHFGLFADILKDLASSVDRIPKEEVTHREQLTEAVDQLHAALTNLSTPVR
jgi:hypothetical protein